MTDPTGGVTDFACYRGGGMLECAIGDMGAAFGGPTAFGLIAGGALILSLYVASDFDIAAPTVGTILIGGMLIPALPAGFQSIGLSIMALGAIVGLFVAARRYVLQVGT